MSFIMYHVAFASLAFVADISVADISVTEYPDESLQYLNNVKHATKTHHDDVEFLQNVIKLDFLWWPILNEMVKIKKPKVYFNQYLKPENEEIEHHQNQVLRPFVFISDLIKTNTFTGCDVRFAMDAIKSAMACSMLKHISMQALMYHTLNSNFSDDIIPDGEKILFLDWLINMVELALKKLISVVHTHDPQQPITRAYLLLIEMSRKLLSNTNPDFKTKDLPEISSYMYEEIVRTCAAPTDHNGYYKSLVVNFNRDKMVEDLKKHRTKITETLKKVIEIHRIETMRMYEGDIIINEDINYENITELGDDVLKKAMIANYFQMIFLYLNLPIQTLKDSQWKEIYNKIILDPLPDE